MKIYLSIETALRVIKFTAWPMFGWPVPPDSKRTVILGYAILRALSAINLAALLPAMMFNIYQNKNDYLTIFLNSTDMIACFALGMFFVICHTEQTRLHEMIVEAKLFLQNATDEELAVMRFYMEKCSVLNVVVLTWCCIGRLIYILAPAVISQPFPLKAAYPFSLEPLWLWSLLYTSHTIIVAQVGSAICLTLLFATLIWFNVARFDMVRMHIANATTEDEVSKCARQHQETLDFADRLTTTVSRMAAVVAASNFLGVTFAGLAITFKQFYSIDFLKLMVFMVIATVHLFLYAWPADYLAQKSQQVSESILHSQWVGKSPKMHNSLFMMMLRADDPTVVKVDGILPVLNLESFGTGLSTAFSYIATLLAIFGA